MFRPAKLLKIALKCKSGVYKTTDKSSNDHNNFLNDHN